MRYGKDQEHFWMHFTLEEHPKVNRLPNYVPWKNAGGEMCACTNPCEEHAWLLISQ